MTIADFTLAAFTLCNSFRVLAYVPQIVRAGLDDGVGIYRQRHRLQRDSADCRVQALPTSPRADNLGELFCSIAKGIANELTRKGGRHRF